MISKNFVVVYNALWWLWIGACDLFIFVKEQDWFLYFLWWTADLFAFFFIAECWALLFVWQMENVFSWTILLFLLTRSSCPLLVLSLYLNMYMCFDFLNSNVVVICIIDFVPFCLILTGFVCTISPSSFTPSGLFGASLDKFVEKSWNLFG